MRFIGVLAWEGLPRELRGDFGLSLQEGSTDGWIPLSKMRAGHFSMNLLPKPPHFVADAHFAVLACRRSWRLL